MKKNYLNLLLCSCLLVACSNGGDDPEPVVKPDVDKTSSVNFRGSIKQASRATETAFEENDEISVFAVKPSSNIVLGSSGNYADNVKYVYKNGKFESNSPITIAENDANGLAYYAIYPYSSGASNSFAFSVKENQSTHSAYTQSDLCTAYAGPTTSKTVNLEFNHRLSNIVIKFYGDNLANKELSVKLEDVYVKCQADINANTYTPSGNKRTVTMGEESTNTFHAIIVPQTVSKDDVFMTVVMNGNEYKLSLASEMTFKSGRQTIFEYEIKGNDIVELNGYINPWNTEDPRLETVVPEEILEKLDDHMPLYTGVNPPNIEGAYFIDPMVAVYCEDEEEGGYSPGDEVTSEYIRFLNQDTTDNTLDFEEYSESGTSSLEGLGAFISGTGNNFTAFFNTTGEDHEEGYTITFKTALVISGTKTNDGIKDLYYAFVMVEKDGDKDDTLMEEGIFRIFKDEDNLSVNTTWNNSRSIAPTEAKYFMENMFKKIKK